MSHKIDISKYIGIPYRHLGRDWTGVNCAGLCVLFFKTEFGIDLPVYDYDEDWDVQGLDLIRQNIAASTRPVDRPARYCLVTFRRLQSKITSHIGILLDENRFLHVPIGGKVETGRLSGPWGRLQTGLYEVVGI